MSERKKIVKKIAKTIHAHDHELGLTPLRWEELHREGRADYKETADRVLKTLADHFDTWEEIGPEFITDDELFLTDATVEMFRGVDH